MSTRDEYVAAMKQAFATLGKQVVVKFVATKVPFLASPFLSPFVGWFADLALKALVESTETGVFFLYIDMRVGAQARGFEAAAYANYTAQQTGTPEEKARAKKKLQEEFVRFASLRA